MKSDGLNIAVVSDNWLSAFGLKCLVSEVSPFAKVFILNSEEYKNANKNIYSHIFDIDNAEGRGAEFWRKFVEDKLKMKEDRESKVCQKPLLTNRETEVLRLVTQGLMNKEIADKLCYEMDKGVTAINALGWYKKSNSMMIMVVTRKDKMYEVMAAVKEIDNKSFFTVSTVMGVYGEGFEEFKAKRKNRKKIAA